MRNQPRHSMSLTISRENQKIGLHSAVWQLRSLKWYTQVGCILFFSTPIIVNYLRVPKGDGLARAQTLTKLLFESDYSSLTASQTISALADDPRLILIDGKELVDTSIMKLAVKYRLVSSGGRFLFPFRMQTINSF